MKGTGEWEGLSASPPGPRLRGTGRETWRKQRGREEMEVKAWGLSEVMECLGRVDNLEKKAEVREREAGRSTALGGNATI